MSERANDPTFSDYTWMDHEREFFENSQANRGDQASAPGGSESYGNSQGYPQPSAPRFQEGSPEDSGVKSWNDISSGISRDGGYHFTQDNQLYYRKGDRLYRANPMHGGDYSVSPIPGDEAGKIHDREILANGQPVYARNKVYYHHEGTVYGAEKKPDGSPR
ncbi:hypothetical protein, partial [Fundidesulfovibrio magnetotacticus]|uniref:hypothetical protein n=1 Tax=Fundidesulfovibrio magnetotacticus TaxID=2730080 RepID=UPI001564F2DA